MYSFSNLQPAHFSMSRFNCCFLTCIQVSQQAGKAVWYSHLVKNFPKFVVIHTIKGFSIVNEAEIDVFLGFSCFFDDPMDVGNLISGSSAFLNPAFSEQQDNILKYSLMFTSKPISLLCIVCCFVFSMVSQTTCNHDCRTDNIPR